MDVVHDITELRKEGSLTDWKHGSGIWRLTHSKVIQNLVGSESELRTGKWRSRIPITDRQKKRLEGLGLGSKIKEEMQPGSFTYSFLG